MGIGDRFSIFRNDPPRAFAERMVRLARGSGVLQDVRPTSLPAIAKLALDQGVGAHMTHGIHARSHPDRLAIVDGSRAVTYAEADAEINRIARGLRARAGARRGEPVALMMENRVEYVLFWIALFRLGTPAVHASYRSTPDELTYMLEHSGARVVIASEQTAGVARAAAERVGARVVGAGGARDVDVTSWELIRGMSARAPRRRSAESNSDNVVYTSGTTGRPKGAVRDFKAIGALELSRIMDGLGATAGERHLVVAPLYHSAAQAFTLLYTALGATIHLLPRFDAADALRAMHTHQITSTFMVPTMIRRLVELPEEEWAKGAPSALHALVSGAAPFPHALRARAAARLGAQNVFDFYGATELGWVTLARGDEMLARPGTVGRALPGQEIAVFDEGGARLPPGEVGVIHVRSPQRMTGYLRDREATEAAARGEWLTVDDLGHLDADGYLYVGGRARDMIISGGVNVYPVEIEEVLARHPDVREVAVVGEPDEEWGERVAAFVAFAPGAEGDFDPIADFARETLSRAKVPRRWERVDALPRNHTGKVLKRTLREWLAPHGGEDE